MGFAPRGLLASGLFVAVGALVAAAPASAFPVAPQTFTWTTPGTYDWVVPNTIDKVRVDMYGGEGGGDTVNGSPGLGGEAAATIYVTPGETIKVNVGGAGGDPTTGAGGYNGGGAGGYNLTAAQGGNRPRGGGGGGASDIRSDSDGMGGYTLDERLLVAGGGGGRGSNSGLNDGTGGAGGGDQGGDGSTNGFMTALYGGWGGHGGTQTGGGAGGADPARAAPGFDGQSGQAGTGGDGSPGSSASCAGVCAGGGGGGGGYYGGGGGAWGRGDAADYGIAGGGGGSGWGPPGAILTAGQNSGDGSVTITEDLSPPEKPVVSGSSPASPSNSDTPKIKGSATLGATVKLYTDSACTGPVAAQGSAATFNSTGLPLNQPVDDDQATTFYATVTDHFATSSDCSDGFTYVEDSTPPDKPSLTTTVPASPGNDDTPRVEGSAETGSSVKLYDTADCSGSPIGAGSAADLASGIEVTVGDDQATEIYATATDAAGNTSGCSDAREYVEDSTPPVKPEFSDTTPSVIGNDDTPSVTGSAEAGSTVRIYTDSACSSALAGSGSAGDFAGSGIAASVPHDTTTTLFATATDAAGNTSPCSDGIAYTEDSTPPAEPQISSVDPAGPANNNAPIVTGTYDGDDSATTYLYLTPDCSGQSVGSDPSYQFSQGGITATIPDDQSVTIYAQEVDAAGNASDCSDGIPYTEDSTPPVKPVFTGSTPVSPSSNQTPKLAGTAEAGSTVRLYTNANCTNPAQTNGPPAVGSAEDFASGFTVRVDRDTTSDFYAQATDAAGNKSHCSDAFAYLHDDVAPAKPASLATSPGSPSTDKTPKVTGIAESGSTVSLYLSPDCSGTVAGHGSAADFAAPGIGVTVPADASTPISALTTDAAGNASECSAAITYVEDSTAPVPTLDTPADGSTTSDTTPTFSGTAGTAAGDSSTVTVEVYGGSSASGTPLATLTATRDATSGAYSVDAADALADGTYTARPVQTDSVGNSGSGAAHTFTVATPHPSSNDQNTQTVPQGNSPQQQNDSTQQHDSTPAPKPMKVVVSHLNVPLVRGHVEVVLKCTGTAAKVCAGTLTLTPTAATTRLRTAAAGGATFRIAAGKSKTIKITPTARLAKLLKKHPKVIAEIAIHPSGASAAAATTRRVTIVAKR